MKILVIAQEGHIRDALEKQFRIRNRTCACIGPAWLQHSETGAARVNLPEKVDVVVNALSLEQALEQPDDALLDHLDVLAAFCARRDLPLIQLSNSLVFDGLEGGVHKELEVAVSASECGKMLARLEGVVSSLCARHLILRTGPLFSSMGENLLTRLLDAFARGGQLVLSDRGDSCPIHASDMARVVSGVIDQLSCGAEAWGTYHYCSADYVTEFQFAEALWSAVSQYKKAVAVSPALEPADRPNSDWQYPLLNCEKILNTFGIKQLPWRAFLAPTVKKYFNPELEQTEPLLTQSIQPVQKENFDG